ncbi:small multi-drug export protein, partial [bacterium]|nr:small multi-drug export protein [bacterium]
AGISIISNIIIIPPILLLLKPVNKWLEGFEHGNNFIEKLRKRTLSKSKLVQKLEYLGLMLFVAIPLPGSGAWTGALIAFFLKMSLKKSLLYIIFGVIVAGVLVTLLTYLFYNGIIKNTGIFIKNVGV